MADDLRHFLWPSVRRASRPPCTGAASRPVRRPERVHADPAAADARSSVIRPATASRSCPRACGPSTPTTPTSSSNCCPAPATGTGCPRASASGRRRIEETDADRTFAVGLIYGPSGCGKSSLVKAGLLPRLAGHVLAVYVEATRGGDGGPAAQGLRKRCPDLPANLGLAETLAALAAGTGRRRPARRCCSSWTSSSNGCTPDGARRTAELVQALRQCDGGHVQCRRHGAGRFLDGGRAGSCGSWKSTWCQGENTAAVDLFDLRHARKVLAAFGRAFGALPERTGRAVKEQEAFLDQAVAGLVAGRQGHLACGWPCSPRWSRASRGRRPRCRESAAREGVGVAFLEETFSRPHRSAPAPLAPEGGAGGPQGPAARAGTDIKGHMRSRASLLEASGYASRPQGLRRTAAHPRRRAPADHADRPGRQEKWSSRVAERGQTQRSLQPAFWRCGYTRYYQLTHDYLVPSLRDWLTRKQKETRRGRAELLLADRAAVWNARPENRQLPSLVRWLHIRWLTRRRTGRRRSGR